MTENKTHPFYETLGEGPYTYAGFFQLIKPSESFPEGNYKHCPKLTSGVGSCAHCGNGILNIFIVKNKNGETFGIGSDCINNLEEDGVFTKELVARFAVDKKTIDDAKSIERRKKALEKRQAKHMAEYNLELAAAKGFVATFKDEDLFSSIEHPYITGKTLLDYYLYCIKGAGDRDLIKVHLAVTLALRKR